MRTYEFTKPNTAAPLTELEGITLEQIRAAARARHESARKAAKARGRTDFPMLPYECSWAFETQWLRSRLSETARSRI